MSDVFGRQEQVLAGGLASDSMFMSWPALSSSGLGLLIQQVGMDYRQPIRRVFELGPGLIPLGQGVGSGIVCDGVNPPAECSARAQTTYYIVGRPEGRLQLQRFVGPGILACDFYTRYGNACGANVVNLSGKAGCAPNSPETQTMFWDMFGLVLDSYRADLSGQEMVMQEGIGAQFASLRVQSSGCP